MAYPPPPPAGPEYGAGSPPPNYLVWTILATIFCCIPVGIVSIVFSSQVNSKWAAGDQAGAYKASKNAKTWLTVTVVLGLIAGVLSLIYNLSIAS
ncbi:CD225/dispanin family protein [Actinomadura sp. KC216]|uniref:CD225/dispanin family protein n=1 Tax=Actinomadura sp. KC216 TaxID=2530370 RepID=UPI00104B5ADF|nr:CD225/dispanin family protein [Actinomadura sp. KC216]TDB89307.1 CD225/dispanin family protein [Actinomadura sp. KC216]